MSLKMDNGKTIKDFDKELKLHYDHTYSYAPWISDLNPVIDLLAANPENLGSYPTGII